MKLIEHKTRAKPTQMTLEVNPLHVWLGPQIELIIEPGDTVKEVAKIVRQHWPFVKNVKQLVTYWFVLGEACFITPVLRWRPEDLVASANRRYLRKRSADQPSARRP